MPKYDEFEVHCFCVVAVPEGPCFPVLPLTYDALEHTEHTDGHWRRFHIHIHHISYIQQMKPTGRHVLLVKLTYSESLRLNPNPCVYRKASVTADGVTVEQREACRQSDRSKKIRSP